MTVAAFFVSADFHFLHRITPPSSGLPGPWQLSQLCCAAGARGFCACPCYGGGDKTKIKTFTGLSAAQINETCVTCHSIHNFKSETAQLKAASDVDTCVQCHQTETQKVRRIAQRCHVFTRHGLQIEDRVTLPGIVLPGYGYRPYTANSVWVRAMYVF